MLLRIFRLYICILIDHMCVGSEVTFAPASQMGPLFCAEWKRTFLKL